ncbi:MAG: DnaJ domain-containing protein [Thermodesulfobacteriota bacterium]
MARKKDLYRILGVNQKADSAKIKKAYRRAAKKYHPDISPKGEEKFREVQQAYETLSDPEKKAVYDLELSKRSVPRPRSYNYAQPLRTGSLRTGPSSLLDEIEQFFSMFEDFWDWRPEFFGEWEEEHTDPPSLEIILTPSEARNGCEVPLEIRFLADCSRCLGSGFKEGFICGLCWGRGKERIQKKIRIIIPSGVKNGMQIRIPPKDRKSRGVHLIATLRVSQ